MPAADHYHREIENALRRHRPFLASVRLNAFFHDLDKVYADYLLWSLSKRVGSCWYQGHKPSGSTSSPTRKEYVNRWKQLFTAPDSTSTIEFPYPRYYQCYQDNSGNEWQLSGSANPARSWYDFAEYHHDQSNCLQDAPTSLLLFIAGTAGVDGLDTKYETGAVQHSNYYGQHTPQTVRNGKVLIATPFGHEMEVNIDAAEEAVVKLENSLENIADGKGRTEKIFKTLQPVFQKTIIRTGRPINDITLADHSLSTAALSTAQAARVVLETAVSPDEEVRYCLPARRVPDPAQKPCQQTGFAVFSCAVNAGLLDAMALELKDITAIREEVQRLFDVFVETFTKEYPVGGEVYRDQHGVHVIVPMLGDPAQRWVQKDNNTWHLRSDPEGITQDEFVDWLFTEARQALTANPVQFGRELLIGCRYAPVLQKLNRLAGAIDWTRQISFLSAAADRKEPRAGRRTAFFRLCPPDSQKIHDDLCGVCGLRQGDRRRKHRKCPVCEERVREHRVPGGEIGDIDKLARYSPDNRMVLFSVGFDLSDWLAEETNSGIFCFNQGMLKNSTLKQQRTTRFQRYNSFGRFRRIWRSTEIFFTEAREEIRRMCRDEEGPSLRMRTILLQPQDMQIILPANLARKALNLVYAKFSREFGRVNGRVPFHVSLCIFPFRVPIYLVLDAARRLKESCLRKDLHETQVSKLEENRLYRHEIRTGSLECGPFDRDRSFDHPMPLIWQQKFQQNNCLRGKDYFHANIRVRQDNGECRWEFAGDISGTEETALMVDNRLALVEIGSGFCLDELSVLSEHLEPTRCHDIPLDYWPQIEKILKLESPISHSQRRGLRAIIARWEKLWRRGDLPGADDRAKSRFLRESVETLWRDPSRFGPGGWKDLDEKERKLLVDSCLNGTLFLASMVEKRLPETKNAGGET